MTVDIKLQHRTLAVVLKGEIDENTARKVRDDIDASVSRYIFDRVIFDFSDVTFMDSSGIGMLIGRYKLLAAIRKPCYITGTSPAVDKILSMTGIYEIIPKISRHEYREVTNAD